MLTRTQCRRLRETPLNGAPNRIEAAIKLAGTTQEAVEPATGIAQSTISKLASGSSMNPTLATVHRLTAFFGCTVEDLFPARDTVGAR